MDKENNILWKKVLGEIETEVSRANFQTLFKPTALLSMKNGVVSIAAPSNMIINLLQKRFYPIIKNAVDKYTNANTKIIFVPKVINKNIGENPIPTPLFAQIEGKKPSPIGHLPRVRADYTFQTLAVSSTNQLAYVSATTVAKKIGTAYNPLFIYGPVGVGKTHLMQAIANEVYKNDPDKKIIYTTSEEFTNEVVEAIRNNDTSRMKRKFRSIDLLILDDVQFFEGKERAQEELFHTFNILVDEGAQIVLSSDRPPFEIKRLEKRLSSRFAGGLTVDIEAADLELRAAILLIKAKKYNIDLSIEIAKKIAEKARDSRELEGLLLKAITIATAEKKDITLDMVENILYDHSTEPKYFLHPNQVIRNICSYYNIKETLIKGQKRSASIVRARQIAMYMLKKELSLSFEEIGNILGGRDHTTIMHGVGKIEKLLLNKVLSEEIMGIKSLLKNRALAQ
ncbi:MAG: chromosomal replication initiator protein DnaA [Candidatus Levybacteria bacterium RIFCSPHIGHO2_02_FULL_37_10]|nr:MAG: chromosomal replication initiator protein DnaA [Candidatus Levybacteria bacterium RIFCSPHIGHO2_02_FULL_37_10]